MERAEGFFVPAANIQGSAKTPDERPGWREADTRIALVNLQADFGGAEGHVLALAGGLAARGHDVRVLCHPRGRLRRMAEGCRLEAVSVPTAGQMDLGAAARLAWQVRRWRPDVLHLHTPKDYLIGTLAGRLSDTTATVITRHLLLPVSPHMRRVYRRADAVICPCRALRDQLAADGVPGDKLALVYGAINAGPFRQAPSRRAGTAPIVGTVGRLVPGKGHAVLLDAFARLGTLPSPSALHIVGDGSEQAALRVQAERLGLSGRVRFLGFQTDVPAVMAALDVFVLASTHTEVLPLVVLEAMAAGCAVVATSVGGVPEIVEDGQSGLLVPPGDADALASALSRFVTDPSLRAALGRAAAYRVEQRFTLPAMLTETEGVYRKACQGRSAGGVGS